MCDMISMTFIPIFGGEKQIPTRSARVWELAFVWEFTPIMVHISLEMEMEIGELYLALAAKSTHGRSFASNHSLVSRWPVRLLSVA